MKNSKALFKELLNLATADKPALILFLVGLIVSAMVSMSFPLALQEFYNLCESKPLDMQEVYNSGMRWSIIFVVGSLASYLRLYKIEHLSSLLSRKLRVNCFQDLMQKEIGVFEENQSAGLCHQLGSDISEIARSITLEISAAVRGTAYFIGGFGFLLYTSVSLTFFFLLPLVLIIFVAIKFAGKLKRERMAETEIMKTMSVFTQERLSQMKTVKVFNAERNEIQHMEYIQNLFYKKRLQISKISAQFYVAMELMGQYAILIVIVFASYLISLDQGIDVGTLTAFAMYGGYAAAGLKMLSSGYSETKKSIGLYAQIKQLTNQTDDKEDVLNLKDSTLGQISIEFDEVSFAFKDSKVLENISFYISPGEVVGLLGESGAGKSTIINLLCKFYKPMSGRVLLGDFNIEHQPESWVRSLVALVSQESLLFTGSILDNVTYFNRGYKDVEEVCKRADAYSFIKELPDGLQTQVGENGTELSGGQRQRICIARALLKNPSILLLDEATSGVDTQSEMHIQKIIEREVRRGYTAIVVTHRVSSIKDFTDKVLFVSKGKVVEFGPYKEIEMNPTFKKLYSNR